MRTRYDITLGPPQHIPTVYTPQKLSVGHRPRPNKVVADVNDMEDPERGFYRRRPDTKGRFLEHGANMLRFEGEWREKNVAWKDRRRFVLQYYLADDTIEIIDKSSAYARSGQFSKFISRQRLPRVPLDPDSEKFVAIPTSAEAEGLRFPEAQSVVNMCQQARAGYKYGEGPTVWGRYLSPITGKPVYQAPTSALEPHKQIHYVHGIPVLTSFATQPDFITAADLICGGIVSILGRPMLLKSCDPYTVAFFLKRLDVDQREGFVSDPATSATKERELLAPHTTYQGKSPLPPHIGTLAIGSELETRINATKITPTYRAEPNFNRFYQLANKVLRFEAKLDPSTIDPADARRKFVVSFYLEDDTLAVVEVIKDNRGTTANRFLARGKYRNVHGEGDREALHAVRGRKGESLLPRAVQAAYDRNFGAGGDKFGYADGFGGAGYTGGVYGKADRVGAGGTGVAAGQDIGLRDPLTHALVAQPRYFVAEDFYPGAVIAFTHMPGTVFILGKPDGFTAEYLKAKEEANTSDPMEIYVPDSKTPVPSLLLEGNPQVDFSSTLTPFQEASLNEPVSGPNGSVPISDLLTIAKILSGVFASIKATVKQADKCERGFVPVAVMQNALAKYGVQFPACEPEVVDRVLHAWTFGTGKELMTARQELENSRATKHPIWRPAGVYSGGPDDAYGTKVLHPTSQEDQNALSRTTRQSSRGFEDPISGPLLVDFGAPAFANDQMIDYPSLFKTLQDAIIKQQTLQPRLDKILPQLRSAILSSRAHLRKVFRDLDQHQLGLITFQEFRQLLSRHHLDIGLNDAQVRAIMQRFPSANSTAVAKLPSVHQSQPCISWMGFVETLLDASTLAPGELDSFLDFVRGIHDTAPDGVGTTHVVPEVFPHVNQVSSWNADMDLSKYGIAPLSHGTRGHLVDSQRREKWNAFNSTLYLQNEAERLPQRPHTTGSDQTRATASVSAQHGVAPPHFPNTTTQRPYTAPAYTQGADDAVSHASSAQYQYDYLPLPPNEPSGQHEYHRNARPQGSILKPSGYERPSTAERPESASTVSGGARSDGQRSQVNFEDATYYGDKQYATAVDGETQTATANTHRDHPYMGTRKYASITAQNLGNTGVPQEGESEYHASFRGKRTFHDTPARPNLESGPGAPVLRHALTVSPVKNATGTAYLTAHPSQGTTISYGKTGIIADRGIAPEMEGTLPRTVPKSEIDVRPPTHGTLDAFAALRNSESGSNLLQRIQTMFGTRRLELFRSFSLYDTRGAKRLNVRAFLDALVSSGLKLSLTQKAELTKILCHAAAQTLTAPQSHNIPEPVDVYIEYNPFLEQIFSGSY